MYKIFWADMGKATGNKEIGKRPVVSIGYDKDCIFVYKITSRNRKDKVHVRINNYIVNGFCACDKKFKINKKYILGYVRDCTSSEYNAIKAKIIELKSE